MAKDLRMSLLLDFYGEMLSCKQREAADLFYNGDLSLSEIADITGITRQGVRNRIVKSEQIITELEDKLGLAGRFGHINREVEVLEQEIAFLRDQYHIPVDRLNEIAKRLKNDNR